MLEHIVSNTNKRIEQTCLDGKFIEITITEFKCFIGLILLFGILKKNKVEINEIWSPNSVQHEHLATASMSRNRFKTIIANLVFDDLETRVER